MRMQQWTRDVTRTSTREQETNRSRTNSIVQGVCVVRRASTRSDQVHLTAGPLPVHATVDDATVAKGWF